MQLNDYLYWIDANLPPKTVFWLSDAFGVNAEHVFSLNLLTNGDKEIFEKARQSSQQIIIITKDEDFVELVLRKKSPPKVIWITAGNLTNDQLKEILIKNLKQAVIKLQNPNEPFVEIR